ncbi:hypothetical protein RJ641_023119 [Dillenia turbinata]|uniref:MalT-like TPR region domain-containing protein n=1 Tax=Dillenia turbinata TaxID=194707 RepID=A0AAN8YXT7_9MAGN
MTLRQAVAAAIRRTLRFDSSYFRPPTTSIPKYAVAANVPAPGYFSWSQHHRKFSIGILLFGQAIILGTNVSPVLADDVSVESSSANETEGAKNIFDFRKIEDGSVISNIHTQNWRIYTDEGRKLSSQGRWDEAKFCFLHAIDEAKEGFGSRDPHVASAFNNLAELYRVKREFDKAEALYLDALSLLEESFGPDDIRVGFALHNLGRLYLAQQKLDKSRECYEIKGRIEGLGNPDYADTLHHLARVLYLQGNENDAEALLKDSIRILEIYFKSNRLQDAEKIQRKILHILELYQGWGSMITVIAAESLALTLQSIGNLEESQELLERCLDVRKRLFPDGHLQIASNVHKLARVMMLNSNQLEKVNVQAALAELNKAEDHLSNAIRMAREAMDRLGKQKLKARTSGTPTSLPTMKEGLQALVLLLQSLDALGLLKISRLRLQKLGDHPHSLDAEKALDQCISAFKEFAGEKLSLHDSTEAKVDYLSCLKHLTALLMDDKKNRKQHSKRLQELKTEIKRVEVELSQTRKPGNWSSR